MNCPICNNKNYQSLLELPNAPIYQHPVTQDCNIPRPYFLDLEYYYCPECGHAFQKHFDCSLMDRIYANHYYTPAPDGVGHQFRDEFFSAINLIVTALKQNCRILEIGSSSGEVLASFKEKTEHAYLMGYEPSKKSAETAEKRGIPTRCEFFSPETIAAEINPYDLIVSRHVIEHIVDFDSFWKAIAMVSHASTTLILETPSLEIALEQPSIAPFHIEHAHVFSANSLASLAAIYGWYAEQCHFTTSGNMIISFIRQKEPAVTTEPPVCTTQLQQLINVQIKKITDEISKRKVILWGAGAGGLKLLCTYQLSPDKLVDGNKNKKGQIFCGQPWVIEYAPDVIRNLVELGSDMQDDYIIVIGSTFYKEIKEQLKELNWKGKVIAPYEWNNNLLSGDK